MKNCPKCGAQLEDNANFCGACGSSVNDGAGAAAGAAAAAPQQNQLVNMQPVPWYDHTNEFDAQDISDNKAYCMLCYLMSVVGIIIALLASKDSPYIKFHVRQAIKLTVAEILVSIVTLLLCWTIIIAFAGGVCLCIIFVLQIIAFFQICGGKAKEPAIIRNLGFLK